MPQFYDVYPKVVPVGKPVTITIRPLYEHCRIQPECKYTASITPTQWLGAPDDAVGATKTNVTVKAGAIEVDVCCNAEQEYVLWIEATSGDTRTGVGEFRIYAVADDLYTRRPFKGDFHMHSTRSDGKETPAYVAGACRRIGLDFMALTDHRRYEPSLEAIHAYDDVKTDLKMFPGEEVHPPETKVHIVNFGGCFSVNALFVEPSWRAEIEALEESLAHIPAAHRYQYATCTWSFNKIRAAGGLAIFAHPYWYTTHHYDVPEALTTLLLENQPYDALELIGGYHRFEIESNTLQVARYHEERAGGRKIAIVGASDAHGCESGALFGWYYSIVFAPSTELTDLTGAIKGLYSVAVEAVGGETPRAHGPFRLVKYAHFLMREVFPLHDEICANEGRLMLAHLAGQPEAAAALERSQGQVAALYKKLLG